MFVICFIFLSYILSTMPRYVNNESEDEFEPKTGRRTRATLAASTTDSPMRRSMRIRQGSVNPDGSSPESVAGATASQVTRVTRRRAAAIAEAPPVTEPPRTLRSRKNSVSSSISDYLESDSVPNTPKGRANKRLSIIESSPEIATPGTKTRRSTRALSETKSPAPVVRTTRRTRATSIDPEPIVERITRGAAALAQSVTSVATPTKKKRTPVSVLPSEPILIEETNDDKVDSESNEDSEILQEKEVYNESSSDIKSRESSCGSLSISIKKLSKDDSMKELFDLNVEVSTSRLSSDSLETAEKSSNNVPTVKKTPSPEHKSGNKKVEESEPAKSSSEVQAEEFSPTDAEMIQSFMVKTKRHSLNKSKELGVKIEDLLNKSTEEQEKSPGNKENQKLNISPKKIRKNLELKVCSVDIVRGKSLGSTIFINKSDESKTNTSLDERVLSKSRYDIVTPKSVEVEDDKPENAAESSRDSNSKKISQLDLPSVTKTPKENKKKSSPIKQETKISAERPNLKTSFTKVDETVTENEVIEEFTLYDSSDSLDESKSEFGLTIEEDIDSIEKNNSTTITMEDSTTNNASQQKTCSIKSKNNEFDLDSESSSNSDNNFNIFDRPKPPKQSSSEDAQEKQPETPRSEKKKDTRRQSTGIKETDDQVNEFKVKNKASGDGDTNDPKTEKNSNKENDMDTNEHEENEVSENSVTVSPAKESSDENKSLADDKDKSSQSKDSKSDSSNQVSDSDSNMIDNLFQNISAVEWDKKYKDNSPKGSQSKRETSLKGKEATDSDDSDADNNFREEKNRDGDDSDDTVILKKNDYPNKASKKRKSVGQTIVEEVESENERAEETVKSKKSLNKSVESNTSIGNRNSDKIEEKTSKRKSLASSQEEGMEIDDNVSEADPSNTDNPKALEDANSADDEIKEKESTPSKTIPKNKKKSLTNSTIKSKKSEDVYEFNESSESNKNDKTSDDETDEDESFVNQKGKSLHKQEQHSSLDSSRTPLNRNFSMVAQVDSNSGSEDITDSDSRSSDSNNRIMPGYLFNTESSSDEIDKVDADAERDESNNTINSDVAKEMNLAGDTDLEYSDDNVPADDCRDSETEHSDENDEGSDMGDFIVADNEIESSEYSDEDNSPQSRYEEVLVQLKSKFKRIVDNSSSEEEKEEENKKEDIEEEGKEEDDEEEEAENEKDEENYDESPEASKKERTVDKLKRKSFCETPDSNEILVIDPLMLEQRKLNYSLDSNKTLSGKKAKKENATEYDLGELEPLIPLFVENIEKNYKKLNKFAKPMRSLNKTIDLCTPEERLTSHIVDVNPSQSPGLNTSDNQKSMNKLKKNLVEDLGASTPDEIDTKQKNEEIELKTSKTKTPNKEKKSSRQNTPKSLNKNNRDSIQLIEETAMLKPNISDLNKSMLTPNSETPETKFLKKERLNESLPLLELKKKGNKIFNKKALGKMYEDEQETNDTSSEINEQKEIDEESIDEESDVNNEDVEENGDEVNGNSSGEDEEKDGTDEEPNKEEENEDEDEENENKDEDEESEDSSEGDIILNKKEKLDSKLTERPEIKNVERNKKSLERNSLSKSEEDPVIPANKKQLVKGQTETEDIVTPNKKRNSTNSVIELLNKKKRSRLESSETPQTPKNLKKMRIMSKTDTPLRNNDESDSDEAPESLGFGEARTEALQAMKDVAANLKALKEAKKKKRRDQLERVRQEKEAKSAKKPTLHEKTKPDMPKNYLKRLPENLLNNLSDLPQRPQKKRKLLKKEEQIVPSRSMFSPGKPIKSSLEIQDFVSPLSSVGGTTHFSVVNLEKVKKQPKKAAAVTSFREQMLARNPRQPVSAFLMYKAKQKASGKHLSSRKQA